MPQTDGQAALTGAGASTGPQADAAQADTDDSGSDVGGTGALNAGSPSGAQPAPAALPAAAADHAHARTSRADPTAAATTAAGSAAPAPAPASTGIDAAAAQPGPASAPAATGLPGPAPTAGLFQAPDALPSPVATTTQTFDLASVLPGDQADGAGAPAQVGASLLTLASSADGTSRMAISLHPKELGAVQVQLERGADGTTRIVVAASEPGTLRSLMTSQDQLHAALDAAAVPTAGRHLSFELSAPAAPAPGHGAANPDTAAGSRPDAPMNADMSGFRDSSRQETGQSQGDRAGGFGGRSRDRSDDASALGAVSTRSPSSTRRLPSGSINITA